jgi:hypothetical protein
MVWYQEDKAKYFGGRMLVTVGCRGPSISVMIAR